MDPTRDTPRPTRYPALSPGWSICSDDEHPDRFTVTGSVAGEHCWEGVGPETSAHSSLRAEAIVRLPTMLAQLEQTHDVLDAISETDDRGNRRFAEFTGDDGTHDRAGHQLAALADETGRTLRMLQTLAAHLGLDEFVVAEITPDGPRRVSDERFASHEAAYVRSRELSAGHADSDGFGPEYLVIPTHLLDSTGEGGAA